MANDDTLTLGSFFGGGGLGSLLGGNSGGGLGRLFGGNASDPQAPGLSNNGADGRVILYGSQGNPTTEQRAAGYGYGPQGQQDQQQQQPRPRQQPQQDQQPQGDQSRRQDQQDQQGQQDQQQAPASTFDPVGALKPKPTPDGGQASGTFTNSGQPIGDPKPDPAAGGYVPNRAVSRLNAMGFGKDQPLKAGGILGALGLSDVAVGLGNMLNPASVRDAVDKRNAIYQNAVAADAAERQSFMQAIGARVQAGDWSALADAARIDPQGYQQLMSAQPMQAGFAGHAAELKTAAEYLNSVVNGPLDPARAASSVIAAHPELSAEDQQHLRSLFGMTRAQMASMLPVIKDAIIQGNAYTINQNKAALQTSGGTWLPATDDLKASAPPTKAVASSSAPGVAVNVAGPLMMKPDRQSVSIDGRRYLDTATPWVTKGDPYTGQKWEEMRQQSEGFVNSPEARQVVALNSALSQYPDAKSFNALGANARTAILGAFGAAGLKTESEVSAVSGIPTKIAAKLVGGVALSDEEFGTLQAMAENRLHQAASTADPARSALITNLARQGVSTTDAASFIPDLGKGIYASDKDGPGADTLAWSVGAKQREAWSKDFAKQHPEGYVETYNMKGSARPVSPPRGNLTDPKDIDAAFSGRQPDAASAGAPGGSSAGGAGGAGGPQNFAPTGASGNAASAAIDRNMGPAGGVPGAPAPMAPASVAPSSYAPTSSTWTGSGIGGQQIDATKAPTTDAEANARAVAANRATWGAMMTGKGLGTVPQTNPSTDRATGGAGAGSIPALGTGTPGAPVPFTVDAKGEKWAPAGDVRRAVAEGVASSGLVGYVPPDGAAYGIRTGSAEEWTAALEKVWQAESAASGGRVHVNEKFTEKNGQVSEGLFSASKGDLGNYPRVAAAIGLAGQKSFTQEQMDDPALQAKFMAGVFLQNMQRKGSFQKGIGATQGPVARGEVNFGGSSPSDFTDRATRGGNTPAPVSRNPASPLSGSPATGGDPRVTAADDQNEQQRQANRQAFAAGRPASFPAGNPPPSAPSPAPGAMPWGNATADAFASAGPMNMPPTGQAGPINPETREAADAGMRAAANTLTFGQADRLAAFVNRNFGTNSRGGNTVEEQVRASDEAARQHPAATAVGGVGGAVLQNAFLPGSAFATTGRTIGTSAALGAADVIGQKANREDDPFTAKSAKDVGLGALIGAGSGALTPAFGRLFGSGYAGGVAAGAAVGGAADTASEIAEGRSPTFGGAAEHALLGAATGGVGGAVGRAGTHANEVRRGLAPDAEAVAASTLRDADVSDFRTLERLAAARDPGALAAMEKNGLSLAVVSQAAQAEIAARGVTSGTLPPEAQTLGAVQTATAKEAPARIMSPGDAATDAASDTLAGYGAGLKQRAATAYAELEGRTMYKDPATGAEYPTGATLRTPASAIFQERIAPELAGVKDPRLNNSAQSPAGRAFMPNSLADDVRRELTLANYTDRRFPSVDHAVKMLDDQLRRQGGGTTYGQLEGIRSDISESARSSDVPQERKYLGMVLDTIDKRAAAGLKAQFPNVITGPDGRPTTRGAAIAQQIKDARLSHSVSVTAFGDEKPSRDLIGAISTPKGASDVADTILGTDPRAVPRFVAKLAASPDARMSAPGVVKAIHAKANAIVNDTTAPAELRETARFVPDALRTAFIAEHFAPNGEALPPGKLSDRMKTLESREYAPIREALGLEGKPMAELRTLHLLATSGARVADLPADTRARAQKVLDDFMPGTNVGQSTGAEVVAAVVGRLVSHTPVVHSLLVTLAERNATKRAATVATPASVIADANRVRNAEAAGGFGEYVGRRAAPMLTHALVGALIPQTSPDASAPRAPYKPKRFVPAGSQETLEAPAAALTYKPRRFVPGASPSTPMQ